MNPKYRCPACGAESFEVTAHVTQDWKIDCNGTFLESLNECVEVTHYPDENDIWDCANCGFSAAGCEFRNQSEEQKGDKEYEPTKKNLEITGRLICPLSVGTAAFIAENGGIRRTSNVLRMERISPDEIRFETCNTNYRLHLIRQEVTA
ncbi:hypothetical protein ASJ35_07600 [Ruthenibacterium lactatiformans]|uniref:Uncharacterized protein n=1 Tax=Ruthenibacterium lactatiformans TaxID=1550024 RepID=A0A0W7TRZ3_9FIRM|nr:hypothetical protein [Ruthenibacterium lactatiformans]KUE76594.1 hypothetical protein ASJ35_07600 [Ruthenibacterium lactatiformans]